MIVRSALMSDAARIERVMRDSIEAIGSRFYDARQVASAIRHIAHADPAIIGDGTYYVVEAGDSLAACGGWSRRGKLFAGGETADGERLVDPASEPARIRAMFVDSRFARSGLGRRILARSESDAAAAGFKSAELMALLSGVALYQACGYSAIEEQSITLPDGVVLPGLRMRKDLAVRPTDDR